ncbi:MAG: cupin domain-containing protein [Verrucomicrobiae bacterium]|nr:cupin domain-containing protein [Verrucomicrobiae bacterium]
MKNCEHSNSKNVNLTAEPVKLADWVQYQNSSIVSREILRKPTGTITVFAFDAGQSLSEHTAPFDALVQVVDGEGEIIIGGAPKNVKTGEIILMPANIPHAVKANIPFKMLLIMIRS